MKALLFSISMFISFTAAGQCDPSFMFEKLGWPEPPLKLLKPFTIPVRAIEGVPFSTQYSIIFGKGIYTFYIKQIGTSQTPLNFTVTNTENKIIQCDTLERSLRAEVMLRFTPEKDDIYNLNLHSARSFDGCIIFMVSFLPEAERSKYGWQMTFPSPPEIVVRKALGKDSLMRKFEFRYGSQSRHAIELEAGQLYALQVPDEQSARNLCIHVRSNSDAQLKTYIVPQKDGYIYYIRPSESGMHRFDFTNPSQDKSAVVLLLKAKERPGLPK